jgi:hypothetical protein
MHQNKANLSLAGESVTAMTMECTYMLTFVLGDSCVHTKNHGKRRNWSDAAKSQHRCKHSDTRPLILNTLVE